jgi:hypothetical protein
MKKVKAVHMAVMDAETFVLGGGRATLVPMEDRIRLFKDFSEDSQPIQVADYPFEPPRKAPARGTPVMWETSGITRLGFSSGVLEEGGGRNNGCEGWLRVYYNVIDMKREPEATVAIEDWTELQAVPGAES